MRFRASYAIFLALYFALSLPFPSAADPVPNDPVCADEQVKLFDGIDKFNQFFVDHPEFADMQTDERFFLMSDLVATARASIINETDCVAQSEPAIAELSAQLDYMNSLLPQPSPSPSPIMPPASPRTPVEALPASVKAFMSLGNDMTPQARKKAKKVVVSAIVVNQIALTAQTISFRRRIK